MIKKILSLLISLLLLLPLLIACAPALQETDAAGLIEKLVTESLLINRIVYGNAFSPGSTGTGNYAYVKDSLGYANVQELKEKIAEIFTPEYSEILCRSAFESFSADEGISYARIIDGADGLMIYTESEAVLTNQREYDFSTLKITKNRGDTIEATIESYIGEQSDQIIKIKLCRIGDGWLLDSPTY